MPYEEVEEVLVGALRPGTCLSAWLALNTQSMNKSTQFDPFKYQMEPCSPLGNNRLAGAHSLISIKQTDKFLLVMWPRYYRITQWSKKVPRPWSYCLWLWVKWTEVVSRGGRWLSGLMTPWPRCEINVLNSGDTRTKSQPGFLCRSASFDRLLTPVCRALPLNS